MIIFGGLFVPAAYPDSLLESEKDKKKKNVISNNQHFLKSPNS